MMMNQKLPYFVRDKKSGDILDVFIKVYIIMNYETAKHGDRASWAGQQGSEAAEEITIEPKDNRMLEGRIWDIAATSVSVCARGWKIWEGSCARREGRSDCKITYEYDQASTDVEEEKERKYQWDYNRIVKALLKTKWNLKRNLDKWSLSMSLIG